MIERKCGQVPNMADKVVAQSAARDEIADAQRGERFKIARRTPARKSGISAATSVLNDEFGDMNDIPFLTIHLRSRQGQCSVSASEACAPLAFARGTTVMLGVPFRAKAYHAASLSQSR